MPLGNRGAITFKFQNMDTSKSNSKSQTEEQKKQQAEAEAKAKAEAEAKEKAEAEAKAKEESEAKEKDASEKPSTLLDQFKASNKGNKVEVTFIASPTGILNLAYNVDDTAKFPKDQADMLFELGLAKPA